MRRSGAVLAMCAVLLITLAMPLAVGEVHTVIRGGGSPRASAVTWTYEPAGPGTYTAKIENHGLRWLTLDIYDSTSGAPELVLHQRIRFSDYNAYPNGFVISESLPMGSGHSYVMTAAPSGQKDSFATITDQFTGPQPPVASFIFSAAYLTVWTDGSSSTDPDGTIMDYAWSWGDGATAVGAVASHTYAVPGIWTVTLMVTDNDGLANSTSHIVTLIPCCMPPVAMFTMTVESLTVLVDASMSYDANGYIVAYDWDFGDGTSGTGVLASHSYACGGTYTITLTVTNDDGEVGSTSHMINLPTPLEPPIAYFTRTAYDLNVTVDASSSYDPDGAIVSYAWNWGDGGTGTGVTASHTYVAYGLYAITLTVTDVDGLTDTCQYSVIAEPPSQRS